MVPTYEEALAILGEYNKDEFHIEHGKTVGGVMRWFAQVYPNEAKDGVAGEASDGTAVGPADFWQIVGTLHDVDFEMYPSEHCVKGVELLRAHDVDDSIIASAMSHGWGMTDSVYEPKRFMEKVLFATDELTGLIGAAVLVRPSKSVQDLEVKSVKKKFKQKSFAAGCDRDTIQRGADMLGWTLDELIGQTIDAMRKVENEA
ncbi:MAG: hydrolase [Coriobacteriales bacterium]|nr:hydrolase [Coriobacteriales bacterium]